MLVLNNLKMLVIASVLVALVWFYKNYEAQLRENTIRTENERQMRYSDSLQYAYTMLSDKQIENYIEDNKDLKSIIKQNQIKISRIQSIVTQSLKYHDDVTRSYFADNIVEAIIEKKDYTMPIIDSTSCLIIKGNLQFKDNKLSLNITDRIFNNKTTTVAFWERKEWKLLFWKTRWFGKKQGTVRVTDECGKSQTLKIEKRE
jgi:hypothetical protein